MSNGTGTTSPVGTGGGTGQGQAATTPVVNKLAAAQQRLKDAKEAQTAQANTVSDLVEKATNLDHTDPQASAQASALRDMIAAATNALETANKTVITSEATVQGLLNEAEKEGLSRDDVMDAFTILGGIGTAYDAWKKDTPPAPQSAGDAYREMAEVAASPEAAFDNARSAFTNKLGNFGVNALQDEEIRRAWEAAGSPDVNAWLENEVLNNPTGSVALAANEMLSPFNVEAKARGMRLDEASQFYDTYDASKFRSPEQQAAMAYATGMADDPLDIQLGEYIGQELAGEYDPEWYRDIREGAFETLHPSMVAAGPGLQAAMFATDAAKRQRQQAGASMAHQTLGRRQAYAPSYASIANMGSPDPLAVTNVGKMGIGEIQPMDPTGPFFASFPARDQDALMAAYDSQKSVGDKITALQQLAETASGVYDRRRKDDPLYLLGG